MIFGKTKPKPLEIKVVTTATASAQRYGLVNAYKRRNCEKSRGLTDLFGSLLEFSGRRKAEIMPSDYACERFQTRALTQSANNDFLSTRLEDFKRNVIQWLE